jgi:hypothetical protein
MRPLDSIGLLRDVPYRTARSEVVFTDDGRVLLAGIRRFGTIREMVDFVKSTYTRLWVVDFSISSNGLALKCALDKRRLKSRFDLVAT